MSWLKDQSKQRKLSINFPPFSPGDFFPQIWLQCLDPALLATATSTKICVYQHTYAIPTGDQGGGLVWSLIFWFLVVSSFPPIKKSTLPETNRHSTCQEAIPKGKDRLATIHFQVLSSFSGEHAEKSNIAASHPENLKPGDDCWSFSHLMVKPLVLWKKIIWQRSLHFSDSFGGPVTNLIGSPKHPGSKNQTSWVMFPLDQNSLT